MNWNARTTMKARCRLRAAVLLVVACLFGTGSAAHGAEKGIATDMSWGAPAGDQDRSAEAISELGAQWVRIDVDWHWLDGSRAEAWATLHRSVQVTLNQGTRVLLSVANSRAGRDLVHAAQQRLRRCANTWEDRLGLMRSDFTHKPGFRRSREAATRFRPTITARILRDMGAGPRCL